MNSNGLPTEMSVWEIAHRWHSCESTADGIPAFKVLDTLRWICQSIDNEQLVAVDYRIQDDSAKMAWEKLPNFLRAIRAGTFNRELLDGVFIWNKNFAKFCQEEGIPPPAFWFGSGGSASPDDTKPLTNQREDRISCRTIARILWEQDPTLTIEAISKHPWILIIGNGRLYTGKATIRNWIKDLNPKPPDERRGRPKESKK